MMADFIYVDKENASSQVNLMSRPQFGTVNGGIVGKTFQTAQSSSQPVRKVLGDVNRESTIRGKPSDVLAKNMAGQIQKQMICKKPWKMLRPAVPASKPSKTKEKSPSLQSVEVNVETKTGNSGVEDIEQMHIVPDKPNNYADIWAVDYPLIPDLSEEDSSDEDSLISDSDDSYVLVIRDYDLEEPDNDDVELTVETMPSIEDIPLPPLEDLLPNSLEFYSSLS